MAKFVKILSETSAPQSSTKFMLYSSDGEPVRFKVVAENHNCDWNIDIYIQTKNYGLEKVACKFDIPDVNSVSYVSNDATRINGNENNIKAAIKFIENVF